jgi:hypothetical protein
VLDFNIEFSRRVDGRLSSYHIIITLVSQMVGANVEIMDAISFLLCYSQMHLQVTLLNFKI